jgi:hypothetical protein
LVRRASNEDHAPSICRTTNVIPRFELALGLPDTLAPSHGTISASSHQQGRIASRARLAGLSAQWHTIKSAALDAVIANGGTVTRHHAVGRDHRRWYDRQRPSLFASAIKAAKATLDPQGLLNPGVLIDR